MQRIPVGIAKKVEEELPDFVDWINVNLGGKLNLEIQHFENQPVLFFNLVWYAASKRISVTIDPSLE